MSRSKKENYVLELQKICNDSNAVVFAHYHGLTVAQLSDLRKALRVSDASLKIVKNTLFKIASKNAGLNVSHDVLKGPIAIAYSNDPVGAAKGMMDFMKKNDALKVVGAMVNNKPLVPAEVIVLSALPSLDELRGRIIGLLQAPATKVAAVLQAPAGGLARVVGAYSAKK